MVEMRELIEVGTVERLFRLLAVIGPVAGLLLGLILGSRKRSLQTFALRGFLIGLCGTLNWILWRLYNALTDRNGLDSVGNLMLNLGLFVLLGAGLGVILGKTQKKTVENPSVPETVSSSSE